MEKNQLTQERQHSHASPEEEKSESGQVLSPPAYQLHADGPPPPPGTVVQKKEEEEGEDDGSAKKIAESLKEKFYVGFFASQDEAGALQLLQGQSLQALTSIRNHYKTLTGQDLEDDFRSKSNEKIGNAAWKILYPVIPLKKKLQQHVTSYLLFETENEGGMLQVLRGASGAQLAELRSDPEYPSTLKWLEGKLSAVEAYEAKKLLQPDLNYQNVKDLIIASEGFFNDDEKAVYNAIMDLNPDLRKALWTEDRQIFSFLSGFNGSAKPDAGSEADAVRKMCLGSDAEMLKERMRLATEGTGTDEAGVDLVVEKTNDLKTGGELNTELTDGEFAEDSLLGMLRDDVTLAVFEQYMAQMGMNPYDRAKYIILHAPGFFENDRDGVNRAMSILTPEQRQKLAADPEVSAAMLKLEVLDGAMWKLMVPGYASQAFLPTADDMKAADQKLDAFREGSNYELALQKLEQAASGMNTDEVEIFQILMEMSPDDREQFKSKKPPVYRTIKGRLNEEELKIFNEILATGSVNLDRGLDYADHQLFEVSWWSAGTNEEMMTLVFGNMTPRDRFEVRLGYFLFKGGTFPEVDINQETQDAARLRFEGIYAMLQSELGDDDLQEQLDNMLGFPTQAELKTEAGRLMAAGIMVGRSEERDQILESDQTGPIDDWIDRFSEQEEVSEQANLNLQGAYSGFQEDGISQAELLMLANLNGQSLEAYQSHLANREQIAEVGSMIAATVAAIVVTVASAGTLGPEAGASLAAFYGTYGVAGFVVAGGITAGAKVGSKELLGGQHYDAMSGEGLKDGAAGFVEGIVTVATMGIGEGLANGFGKLVGVGAGKLPGRLGALAADVSSSSLGQFGKTVGKGFVSEAVEGSLGAMADQLVVSLMDQEAWNRGVWDMLSRLGGDLLKSGLIGGATGGVSGGALRGGSELLTPVIREVRISKFRESLTRTGLDQSVVQGLDLPQAKELDRVYGLLKAGNESEARVLWNNLQSKLDEGTVRQVTERWFNAERLAALREMRLGQTDGGQGPHPEFIEMGGGSQVLEREVGKAPVPKELEKKVVGEFFKVGSGSEVEFDEAVKVIFGKEEYAGFEPGDALLERARKAFEGGRKKGKRNSTESNEELKIKNQRKIEGIQYRTPDQPRKNRLKFEYSNYSKIESDLINAKKLLSGRTDLDGKMLLRYEKLWADISRVLDDNFLSPEEKLIRLKDLRVLERIEILKKQKGIREMLIENGADEELLKTAHLSYGKIFVKGKNPKTNKIEVLEEEWVSVSSKKIIRKEMRIGNYLVFGPAPSKELGTYFHRVRNNGEGLASQDSETKALFHFDYKMKSIFGYPPGGPIQSRMINFDEIEYKVEMNTEMTPCDACDRNIQIAEEFGAIDLNFGVDYHLD